MDFYCSCFPKCFKIEDRIFSDADLADTDLADIDLANISFDNIIVIVCITQLVISKTVNLEGFVWKFILEFNRWWYFLDERAFRSIALYLVDQEVRAKVWAIYRGNDISTRLGELR